jgi:hypothetical protein
MLCMGQPCELIQAQAVHARTLLSVVHLSPLNLNISSCNNSVRSIIVKLEIIGESTFGYESNHMSIPMLIYIVKIKNIN